MSTSTPAGLCESCAFQRVITSGKGSSFSLCRKEQTDARFPRYPRLPVMHCIGYEPRPPTEPHEAHADD